jgi:hypothetical protein
LEIGNSPSGTHSIQTLIEIINTPNEELILQKCVEKNILKLSYNSNGTHIIQKIISCFSENRRIYLNEYILQNLVKICSDPNGICVIKKFISSIQSEESKMRILHRFAQECIEISQDPYGNYAIQFLFELFNYNYCSEIISIIAQNFISLSMQKFSSNVVEKCIQYCDPQVYKKLVNEMFLNHSNFHSLLKNKYGQFVLQKAILRLSPEDKFELKDYLIKRVIITSSKEKQKFSALLDIM